MELVDQSAGARGVRAGAGLLGRVGFEPATSFPRPGRTGQVAAEMSGAARRWPEISPRQVARPPSALSRIYAMNLAPARRQERRPVIGGGACLPVRQARGPELSRTGKLAPTICIDTASP